MLSSSSVERRNREAREMETERRLFATEMVGGRAVYRLHAVTVAAGILLVLYYRATHVPAAGEGRAAWLGMLAAELWYSFYWVITQSVRWSPVNRRPFRDRLAARFVHLVLQLTDVPPIAAA
jgi:hypothetical protein